MNILLTGCNGQLGNEIQLLENKMPQHKFFNTDINELDITNKEAVENYIKQNNIQGVINSAAYTAVDKAETDKEKATEINTLAPAYLATEVEKQGGWIIQISTDYVFNGTAHKPYKPETTPSAIGVYGNTKLAGEMAVSKLCKNAMIIRTAWLYSSFGNNFVKTMIKLGKERDKLTVVDDQIGSPTYAADLAVAIITAINKGIVPGVYHFTNEGVASWYDFAKEIHSMAGITTCDVQPIHSEKYPTPAQRPHYSVLDKEKIKDTYNIIIPHWKESLKVCIGKLNT